MTVHHFEPTLIDETPKREGPPPGRTISVQQMTAHPEVLERRYEMCLFRHDVRALEGETLAIVRCGGVHEQSLRAPGT